MKADEFSQKFDFAKPTFKHIPTDNEIVVPVSGGKDSTGDEVIAFGKKYNLLEDFIRTWII